MAVKFYTCLFLFLIGLCSPWSPVFADTDGPLVQIKSSVENVIGILTDESLQGESKKEAKRSRILNEVERRFNFRLMAELALGNVWARISERQQDEFARLFGDLLKNTYIKRVEGYSGEMVVYGKELVKENLAQVSSIFEKNNTQMSIVYKMRKENGQQWLVYDVVIEGASIVKQYRRQFAQIIDQEEFNGLMIRLEDKMKTIKNNT